MSKCDQKMSKPVFDLIIGCNSMEKLGIVMDFKAKSTTIDEIILPMKNIASLTNKSKIKEAWAISNALAHEPISTELATQCAVKICRPPGSSNQPHTPQFHREK